MKPHVENIIAGLPTVPGVYLMRDGTGQIFYVGKAKNLRARVRSYFSGSDSRAFVQLLDGMLEDLEVILTDSDKEALLLENELIKKHHPRFNIKLTDDKNFLCLKLDSRHPYPRLEVTRRMAKDGARYFGPYHSAQAIRETLRIVNRFFQLRTCSDAVLASRSKPCLQYQIKRCPAPCVYDLSGGVYANNVESVAAFLEGRTGELLQSLKTRMQAKSQALEFESAAQLRDQIMAVEKSLERQRMVSSDLANRDIIGFYREGPCMEVHVLHTRGGRLRDAERFSFIDTEVPSNDILAEFSTHYYTQNTQLPDEILMPPEMDWADALEALLYQRVGRRVRVVTPVRGDKKRLLELAARNAHQAYIDNQRDQSARVAVAERLQHALHLTRVPHVMECLDISHFQGSNIVASVVRFEHGLPHKAGYRRYKIKSVDNQNDFQSMYEVLSRRAQRGLEDGDLPDLFVIDGGKGQLGAAQAALNDHGIDHIDIIGLAKSRLEVDDRSPERIFVRGQKNPVILAQNSKEILLLSRMRDEAHRFAITFHRQQRSGAQMRSSLQNIAGIGVTRRKLLLKTFGSLKRVQQASIEELQHVLGTKLAQTVFQALHAKA